MKFKHLFSLFCVVVVFSVSALTAYADSSPVMVQSYINEKNIDIFLSDDYDESKLSVKAANQVAKVLDCGSLSEEAISIRTIILLDISTSMPMGARDKVIEFIKYKIENISKNEQLSIITFGTQIATIQNFTSDRYDLAKAANSIKFDGNQSAIYDAIYKTMPKVGTLEEKPCFYRTIAITDGADYTAQGVTKEELFIKLQAESYPIDVVCVSKSKPSNQNKDLSALTRISNGRYFDLYPEADAAQLSSNISVSNYFWVRAELPVALLDGSTRQIDISDGTNHTSFDIKMSVVDAPIVTPPASSSSSSTSSSVQQPVSSSSSEILPDLTTSEDNDKQGVQIDTTLLIIIIAAVVVVAAAAVIIVVIVNKKKQKQTQPGQIQHSYHLADSGIRIGATEIIEESEGREHYSIKISNAANQNENWILNVFSDIIIGRAEGCAIRIDEKSVSREQCKIAANKNGLAISNLSSSNKTKLNGTVLVTEVLLHPADNIHFGRITLRVDYIQKVTDEVPPQSPPPSSSGVGKTQSIF